jgi:lycopene cyclase CruP
LRLIKVKVKVKVATTLGFNLSGVGRGALTTPLKFRFWTLKESHAL